MRFLADGHRVATTFIIEREREELLAEVDERDEDRLMVVRTDVTDENSVRNFVESVTGTLGPPEIFIHLVGAWKGGRRVHEESLETWDRMLQLNLTSAFLCCRAALPAMIESGWGRIILVSARTAREGSRDGQAAYAVAKAGVAMLAEAIAEETRGTGVTANVVAPSVIDTAANRAAMPEEDPSRWVRPEDVAAATAFLASEEGGQLRGAWLSVYGSA